jgi:hypothetical protein
MNPIKVSHNHKIARAVRGAAAFSSAGVRVVSRAALPPLRGWRPFLEIKRMDADQNVLAVYEAGSEGDRDFIAIELVEARMRRVWCIATSS